MEPTFILSCESTVDLPYTHMVERKIPVLFYSYLVGQTEYPDDMGRDPQALPRFYEILAQGTIPTTSQLNEFQYEAFFQELLQQGDVLHIAFGSGMTGSVHNAQKAAARLREQYPHRTIQVIDSLCSSSGYGLLVEYGADLRDEGKTLEQTAQWILEHRSLVHHQFFSTDLQYFRRSGRISGPAAMLGSVLNLCPIMRLDDGGRIIAYDKVRGKKKAIAYTVQAMAQHAQGGTEYQGKCYICHANCPDDAKMLRLALEEQFPHLAGNISILDIGTIIASHCGPGTVAVFFLGDPRLPHHTK